MANKQNLIYTFLAILTAVLFIDSYMIYCVAIVGMFFLFLAIKQKKVHTNKMMLVFVAIASITVVDLALGVIPEFSNIFSTDVAIKEIYRVIIYLMIMELMCFITVDIKVYSRVWRGLLFFIVLIAILQYAKIFDVDSILKRIYGNSTQFYNSSQTELTKFRCGSVFVNPNVFACFLVAMLGSYLFILRHTKENILMKILTFGMIIIGFVLSGSRTGFVLSIVALGADIYMGCKIDQAQNKKGMFTVVGIIALFFALTYLFDDELLSLSDLRFFKLGEGVTNSFNVKLDIFADLIKNMNAANILTGYGPFNYASNGGALLVDFDLGYFITFFGIVGLAIYFAFLYAVFKWGQKNIGGRRYMNVMFLIITIVFGFTAGVYFNLRIFSIYMLMFLPAIKSEDKLIA